MSDAFRNVLIAFPYPPGEWTRISETALAIGEVKILADPQRFGCYGMSFRVQAKPETQMSNHAVWCEFVWENETPDFLASCKSKYAEMLDELAKADALLSDFGDCPRCGQHSLARSRHVAVCQLCPYIGPPEPEEVNHARA